MRELFLEDEVEVIWKIPLSVRLPDDKLVWHFDTHGFYSVKSGYRIDQRVHEQHGQASSSSTQAIKSVWKKYIVVFENSIEGEEFSLEIGI